MSRVVRRRPRRVVATREETEMIGRTCHMTRRISKLIQERTGLSENEILHIRETSHPDFDSSNSDELVVFDQPAAPHEPDMLDAMELNVLADRVYELDQEAQVIRARRRLCRYYLRVCLFGTLIVMILLLIAAVIIMVTFTGSAVTTSPVITLPTSSTLPIITTSTTAGPSVEGFYLNIDSTPCNPILYGRICTSTHRGLCVMVPDSLTGYSRVFVTPTSISSFSFGAEIVHRFCRDLTTVLAVRGEI